MAGQRGRRGGHRGGRGGLQSEGQPFAGDGLQVRASRRGARGGGFAGCGGRGQVVVGGLHGVNKGTKWDLQTTAFTNRLHHCPSVSLTLVGVELGVLLLW